MAAAIPPTLDSGVRLTSRWIIVVSWWSLDNPLTNIVNDINLFPIAFSM